jgi:hypothetical protein
MLRIGFLSEELHKLLHPELMFPMQINSAILPGGLVQRYLFALTMLIRKMF